MEPENEDNRSPVVQFYPKRLRRVEQLLCEPTAVAWSGDNLQSCSPSGGVRHGASTVDTRYGVRDERVQCSPHLTPYELSHPIKALETIFSHFSGSLHLFQFPHGCSKLPPTAAARPIHAKRRSGFGAGTSSPFSFGL